MLVFTIYCDSVDLREGRQIQQISPALANAQVISIKQTITENPPFIQRLLRYDRPDVILVWETTTSANPLVACSSTMYVKRFSSDILFQF